MGPFYMYWYFCLVPVYFWTPFHLIMGPSIFISNSLNYFWFSVILRSALVASPAQKKARNKAHEDKALKKTQ